MTELSPTSKQPHGLERQSSDAVVDDLVRHLVPLCAMTKPQRREMLRSGEVISVPAGQSLPATEFNEEHCLYLISGTVAIELRNVSAGRSDDSPDDSPRADLQNATADNTVTVLRGTDDDARYALTAPRGMEIGVRAEQDVALFLKLEGSLLSTVLLWAQSSASHGLLGSVTSPDGQGAPGATVADSSDISTDLGWLPKLLRSELFSNIPPANLFRVFELMEPVSVRAGETVIRQGETGVYYYIIREGRSEVSRQPAADADPYRLAVLEPGDSFGEEALVADTRRNASVTMLEDGELLRLTKENFVTLVIQPALRQLDPREAIELSDGGGALWVDVRLPEEHARDGLDTALHIPLSEIRERASELSRERRYILYCNAGRRSSAAALLLGGLGFEVFVMAGGLRALTNLPPGSAEPERRGRNLQEELARADADLEAALRLKVEATAARRVFADETSKIESEPDHSNREKAQLRSRLKRLELESIAAGQSLAQTQRRKLEAAAELRSDQARAAKLRAQAESECERLRTDAETKLKAEETQLRAEYEAGEADMVRLNQARVETKANFEQERDRMEQAMNERLAEIEREAEQLQARMAEAKAAGALRVFEIQQAHETATEALRSETEQRLRREREKLELELATASQQIEEAKRRVAELDERKRVADQEARELTERLKAQALERERAVQAAWEAKRSEIDGAVQSANEHVSSAQAAKAKAEAERQALYQELERLRAGAGASNSPGETTLTNDLAAQDARIEAANGAVDQAEQVRREAESARQRARETEAQETAAEKELRLNLYAEAEAWLESENSRAEADLAAARDQVARMEQAGRELQTQSKVRKVEEIDMISDIRIQLEKSAPTDPLSRAIGHEAEAAERKSSGEHERYLVAEEKAATKEALARAKAHIERLKGSAEKGGN